MKSLNRRSFTTAVAASSLAPAILRNSAFAQSDWASETLQIMAPAAPGGGWDSTAREIQRNLQETGLVSTVEVFNVEGAGGTIGLADLASRHSGDGHMMMVMGLVMIGAIGLNQAPVGLDQSTPIARLTGEWEVIVVPAASEIQTIDELMDLFREDAASVSWAGGSAGGTDHLLVGLLAQDQDVDPALINYVPFSGGGEALSSLLGNETTAGVSGIGEWGAQIEAGELRALAVSGRDEGADETVPTLVESGIDVELSNWRGIVAPPDIDDADREAMVETMIALNESEEWTATLENFEWSNQFLAGDEFVEFITEESERVGNILLELGLLEEE